MSATEELSKANEIDAPEELVQLMAGANCEYTTEDVTHINATEELFAGDWLEEEQRGVFTLNCRIVFKKCVVNIHSVTWDNDFHSRDRVHIAYQIGQQTLSIELLVLDFGCLSNDFPSAEADYSKFDALGKALGLKSTLPHELLAVLLSCSISIKGILCLPLDHEVGLQELPIYKATCGFLHPKVQDEDYRDY